MAIELLLDEFSAYGEGVVRGKRRRRGSRRGAEGRGRKRRGSRRGAKVPGKEGWICKEKLAQRRGGGEGK